MQQRNRITLAGSLLVAPFMAALVAVPATAAEPDSRRFIQVFMEDAAIVVDNAWIEGQVRWQDLSAGADLFSFGPVIAVSPIDRLEVGGHLNIIDIDLGPVSESGVGDTTLYGKWQFFHNPIQFTVGVELFLPTGDDDKFLGTGEFDGAIFASVRKNLDEASVTGYLGFRSNGDSTQGQGPLTVRLNGNSSVFLGGAVMFPTTDRFDVSLELQVETERYDSADALVEVTAGGHWHLGRNFTLRGGLGLGLEDGSPDWEAVVGAAWQF